MQIHLHLPTGWNKISSPSIFQATMILNGELRWEKNKTSRRGKKASATHDSKNFQLSARLTDPASSPTPKSTTRRGEGEQGHPWRRRRIEGRITSALKATQRYSPHEPVHDAASCKAPLRCWAGRASEQAAGPATSLPACLLEELASPSAMASEVTHGCRSQRGPCPA